jgi:hypothetical protein
MDVNSWDEEIVRYKNATGTRAILPTANSEENA